LVGELFNTVTDPTFGGYYDRFGFEGADKCSWTFGATYTAANGQKANVRLGNRDFLLQRLWAHREPTQADVGDDRRRTSQCVLDY
jgi:hypothetical protein